MSASDNLRHMALAPGTLLGPYEIVGQLGAGGMGEVYRARDLRLDRAVAIKVVRRMPSSDRARARFWREARAAASVSHPNICQLYDVGDYDGELYLAMELLTGESLAARIARGPIQLSETVELGLSLLSALNALHSCGLIHRDLKPSNIFLTAHGLKLLDFGLARPTNDDTAEVGAGVTLPGMIVGTPGYMAPEQLSNQALDARTDLFAAGVILFEMLTGRSPFAANSLPQIAHAVLYEQSPALAGSQAVATLDRVIHR
ncbi:MAG TPA: serine/threonine-protein kinase, partial [Gemmataceae bacterium]|nr:serine/threonine-protein kinase [Gemmataceae bacterium]